MKAEYCVIEVKTSVVLTIGSHGYCQKWISENCKYNEKYDFWKDIDNEPVTISII